MSVKIKLKHSSTANKAPLPVDLVEGELALNINAASPAAYIKDSTGAIVKIGGVSTAATPGVVQLADAAAVTAGTTGRVVDAAQLKAAQASQAGSSTAPAAPIAGHVWINNSVTPAVTNVWSGSGWIPQVGATVSSGTAPATPAAGQVWVNTSVTPNTTSIWSGTAWVAAKPDGAAVAAIANDAKYATKAELATENTWDRTGTALAPANAGDVVSISAGIAALPGLTPVGDPNTGIYSPGADQLAVATNGTERARIDSSGRLLVGTSTWSAASRAAFVGNSSAAVGNADVYLARGSAASAISPGDSVGTLSFSDNAGGRFAYIAAETDGTSNTNDYPGRLIFSTTAGGASSPTERMRITSGGKVLVGTTTTLTSVTPPGYVEAQGYVSGANYNFSAGGKITGFIGQNKSGNTIEVVNVGQDGSGSLTVGVALAKSATSWSATSDERLKTDLEPIADGLEKVATLRAVTGRYKTDEVGTSRSFLIAQDVQAVLPEAVSGTTDDDDQLSLRYTEVIPLLVAALKEAKDRIENLEAAVASLTPAP